MNKIEAMSSPKVKFSTRYPSWKCKRDFGIRQGRCFLSETSKTRSTGCSKLTGAAIDPWN